MNWLLLTFRNLWFHRKSYLTVLTGVVISATVLTGALIVGDSVRSSLQRLTDIRLGKIRYALQTNGRFFRQELVHEISARTSMVIAPVLQAGGIAINSDKNLRINQVQVIGIDSCFGNFWNGPLQMPRSDEAVISRNVAEKLNLNCGDDLLLRIQKLDKAPSDAPFVSEIIPSVSIRVKVAAIASDEQMGRYSLKNNQTAPFNVFLSLRQMAGLLELPGFANLMLATGKENPGSQVPLLDSAMRICWKPVDAGLHFAGPDGAMKQITTERVFFVDPTANLIL